MTDLSLGDDLAAPMQPEATRYPWMKAAWDLHYNLPDGFVVAGVGRYRDLADTPEEPWQAFVSVTHWGPDGLPGQPVRSTSWHESEAAAKAAVERTIEAAE